MGTETLDASRYTNGTTDERLQFARDFVSSLNKHGYAKLRNHGISSQDVRELFSWVWKQTFVFNRCLSAGDSASRSCTLIQKCLLMRGLMEDHE